MIKSKVKASPFIHGSENTLNLHLDLLIGLLSVMIISVVQNGLRALALCLFSALTAWVTEKIGLIIAGREKLTDLRSLAMGLIIAMLCPVTIPLWVPISASFISVLFVRVIYFLVSKSLVAVFKIYFSENFKNLGIVGTRVNLNLTS